MEMAKKGRHQHAAPELRTNGSTPFPDTERTRGTGKLQYRISQRKAVLLAGTGGGMSNRLTSGYTQRGFVEARFVRQPCVSWFLLVVPGEIS